MSIIEINNFSSLRVHVIVKVKENRRNFSLQYRKYGKKEDTRDEKQEETTFSQPLHSKCTF